MTTRFLDYGYILATIVFTVYGQMALKWRIADFGPFPADLTDKMKFMGVLIVDPIIISGFVAAFFASMAWMAAMTKFELSHAYPFMSLNFVLVFILSVYILNEQMTLQKIIGLALIIAGVIMSTLT